MLKLKEKIAYDEKPARKVIRFGWGARLSLILSAVTCLAYVSTAIPPHSAWLFGFVALSIPLLIGLNVIMLLLWAIIRPIYGLIPLITIILGFRFISATFAGHERGNYLGNPEKEFSIVSYNAQTFHAYGGKTSEKILISKKMLKWLIKSDAEIICLQEYYDRPGHYIFDIAAKLKEAGYTHKYISVAQEMGSRGRVGMAIFSKYPIENPQKVYSINKNNNQVITADIISPKGKIRVYNFHLRSIGIKENELVNNDNREDMKRNLFSVFGKVKDGFVSRGDAVNAMIEDLEKRKDLPVIIAGDMNETPYSYIYFKLKDRYRNAFEDAGHGFGHTYNGNIPFLRIDNIFCSNELVPLKFSTHPEIPYSDHFPIKAEMTFKASK